MATLFSYVVEHDYGIAPHVSDGICTLVKCKYSTKGIRKNIVELAEEGDWITGTGGANTTRSTGKGTLIYAMRVDEKLPLRNYNHDARFRYRSDRDSRDEHRRFALISRHFFYFGRKAINLNTLPKRHLNHPFEKKGPAYRNKFSPEFVYDFVEWLESNHKIGVHGLPCVWEEEDLIQININGKPNKQAANTFHRAAKQGTAPLLKHCEGKQKNIF